MENAVIKLTVISQGSLEVLWLTDGLLAEKDEKCISHRFLLTQLVFYVNNLPIRNV